MDGPARHARARGWCLTVNNPTDEDRLHMENAECRYIVWQREQEADGTEHFQGYIEFSAPMRFNAVKTMLGGRVHLEVRRGSRVQARAYAMKDDTRLDGPWERGDFDAGGQGRRSDLHAVAAAISGGSQSSDIADAFPVQYIKFNRGIERLVAHHHAAGARDGSRPVTVELLVGPTGTGKSRAACEENQGAFWLSAPAGAAKQVWFDEYNGQDTIVLDDFYGWMPYSFFLRLADRYPLQLPVKGAYVKCCALKIVITSNVGPERWYPNVFEKDPTKLAAVQRRINSTRVFE